MYIKLKIHTVRRQLVHSTRLPLKQVKCYYAHDANNLDFERFVLTGTRNKTFTQKYVQRLGAGILYGKYYGGRLSFKTQLKIEFSFTCTRGRKVLEI